MNYYDEIKERLIKSEIYDRTKDYSKDRNKVKVYFEIGKLLNDAGKEYGQKAEVGQKYNERNLRYMRKFYEIFSNEKLNPLGSKLSWSHYRELLSINNINEIIYYISVCEKNNLSKRSLQEKIKDGEYDRLNNETKNKLINQEQLKVDDLILNPIVIRSNYLKEEINEYTLKQLILNNLDDFLIQLGIGFTYVGNEFKINVNNRYNYIDLLLYNIEFNCYIVIELKTVELKKEHIGQVQFYMNYIDENIKKINQNKTIGIIICKQDNKYVIKYSSDKRIISRTYELI